MSQHFLLSAAARTLSLKSIYKGGEAKAYRLFCKLRRPETKGRAICPKCDRAKCYDLPKRRKFQCKACSHQFSVTSGTIFASRKIEFTDLLAAICLIANAAKGISMLQLSRDLDCQYKTAFVLAHKIREALASEVHTGEILDGHVEIDGAFFGGKVREANQQEDRVDRRLARHQTGKRRVVVTLRERKGRTLPFITRTEAEGVPLAMENVSRSASMSADDASHWDRLHEAWPVDRINHSKAYSDHGKHTNLVESFFSRLRRMVGGQHHHVSPDYLHQFANHAAWMKDHRLVDNGANVHAILEAALDLSVSRAWKGYWQRSIAEAKPA